MGFNSGFKGLIYGKARKLGRIHLNAAQEFSKMNF